MLVSNRGGKRPPRLNMADHLMAASPQSPLGLQSSTASGMKGWRKKPIKGFGDRIPAGPHASIDSWLVDLVIKDPVSVE